MSTWFLAEAEAKLDVAVEHYNAQVPGLGTDFADEVRDSLIRLERFPEAWQSVGRRVWRYRLKRFP